MELKEFSLQEILNDLPDIKVLNFDTEFDNSKIDLLILTLGFETRTYSFADKLSKVNFNCDEVIIFNYSTNVNDNIKNKIPLQKALKKEGRNFLNLDCDSDSFSEVLRKRIVEKISQKGNIKIVFDISVCSSKLLLTSLNVLLDSNIELKIVYSEAAIYYPIYEEYLKNPNYLKDRNMIGISQGVNTVSLSQDYVGDNIDNKPEFAIAFPTFKPDRTKTTLIEIDEGIFSEIKKRLIWIVGQPHMEEPHRSNRIKMLREINEINDGEDSPTSYEISTLDYKETMSILEKIYQEKINQYHINISDLGSKMQSLGIALYCHIRPEISIYFSVPAQYNPERYSEGVKNHWVVDFGSIYKLIDQLNSVDTIRIRNKINL